VFNEIWETPQEAVLFVVQVLASRPINRLQAELEDEIGPVRVIPPAALK